MRAVYDLGEEHVDGVLALFAGAWWSQRRTRDEVAPLFANSDVAVAMEDDDGTLVAFARALSDGTHRAAVFDVMVAPEHQRRGVGQRLMEALLAHPSLRDVEAIALWCKPEHVPFYRRLGFSTETHGMTLLHRGDVSGE